MRPPGTDAPPRLLFVDDEPGNLTFLSRVFHDYQTVGAATAVEAWNQLGQGPPPSLILLDITMPGEDGFSLCRRLKADPRFASIPVIFLTGLAEGSVEARALGLGAVDFVAKPVSPAVARARVATHLALTAAVDQLAHQNRVLDQRVAQRTAQLQSIMDQLNTATLETIVRLSRAAEYRDERTGTHVLRVGHYAGIIARRLGHAAEAPTMLRRAAPLHDIGKVAIPDAVLLKPGPLSPDEQQIMRQHCCIGARLLAGSRSDIVKLGEIIAHTHHEKWNGEGYPQGLAGEAIPIAGRIVALADCFDALTSDRPYKTALTPEAAFDLVASERGRHFDPAVVDAFLGSREDVRSIIATYAESDAPAALMWAVSHGPSSKAEAHALHLQLSRQCGCPPSGQTAR